MRNARSAILGVFALVSLAVACSAAPPTEESTGQSTEAALTTADAIARAEQWVAVKLPYCQAANGARDYDAACATYCKRPKNAQWDPYRSDCSGLVSWAWGLPAPGRVTGQFAPFVNDISKAIPASTLRAGDAVNNSTHVMLFKAWVTPGKKATFIEEPGCSSATPYAHEVTSNVTLNGNSIAVAYNGETFTAIRYEKLTTPAPGPAPKPDAGSSSGGNGAAPAPSSGGPSEPESPSNGGGGAQAPSQEPSGGGAPRAGDGGSDSGGCAVGGPSSEAPWGTFALGGLAFAIACVRRRSPSGRSTRR